MRADRIRHAGPPLFIAPSDDLLAEPSLVDEVAVAKVGAAGHEVPAFREGVQRQAVAVHVRVTQLRCSAAVGFVHYRFGSWQIAASTIARLVLLSTKLIAPRTPHD